MNESILEYGNMKAVRNACGITVSPSTLSLIEARVLSIWLVKEIEMSVFAQELPGSTMRRHPK